MPDWSVTFHVQNYFFFKGESYYYKTWCLFIRVGFKIHYKREYCVLHVIKIHHIIFQLLLYKHLTRDVIKKLNNFQCNITSAWWNLSFFSFCRSFQQKSPLCIHLLCVVGKNLGIQQSPVNQLTVILSENSELMIDRQWITVRWEELVTIIINSRGSVCRENSGQSSLFWPDASAHDVPSQLISSFCPNNWMLRLLMTVDSKIFGLHRMIKKC